MPNPSELQRHLEMREALETCCMVDFYKSQTETENPTIEEVEEYFNKLTTAQIDEDMLAYAIFEKQYIQEAMRNEV